EVLVRRRHLPVRADRAALGRHRPGGSLCARRRTASRGDELAMANVLDVTELSVAFPSRDAGWRGSDVTIVDRVSLSIAPGEIVGLVGESGSGKSTTARGILRLIPSSGQIALHGVDISNLGDRQLRPHRRHAQMVFQDPYSSLDPAMTVAALLGEAMRLDGV